MTCIWNISMSEQTKEGERVSCILRYSDVRTDRRRWAHERPLEYLDVRPNRRRRAWIASRVCGCRNRRERMGAWSASWVCWCQNRPGKVSAWAASWAFRCQKRLKMVSAELNQCWTFGCQNMGPTISTLLHDQTWRLTGFVAWCCKFSPIFWALFQLIMANPRTQGVPMICILSIWMLGRIEGELMNGILSMWMSEHTEEGERMNCMLGHIDVRTDRRSWAPELHFEYLDVITDRRRWAHELHLEYLHVRTDRRSWAPELHLEYLDARTEGRGCALRTDRRRWAHDWHLGHCGCQSRPKKVSAWTAC